MAFIDATRGAAMFFVFLAHFGYVVFGTQDDTLIYWALYLTTHFGMIASPTFMLVSGALLGFMSVYRSAADFRRFCLRLVDRGLFLLSVGHVLILIAHQPMGQTLRWAFITDVIGVCLLLGPFMVGRLSVQLRMILGGMVMLGSWLVYLTLIPDGKLTAAIQDTLVGIQGGTVWWGYHFPLLPWLGLYLMGTGLGEFLARAYQRQQWRAIDRRLLGMAAVAFAAGAGMHAVSMLLGWSDSDHPVWLETLRVGEKLPPSPAYFLFYGASALVLLDIMIRLERSALKDTVLGRLTPIGQSSLFVFILQYYMYYSIAVWWFPRGSLWSALLLLPTLAFIYGATMLWRRFGLDRLLTLGRVSRFVGETVLPPVPKVTG